MQAAGGQGRTCDASARPSRRPEGAAGDQRLAGDTPAPSVPCIMEYVSIIHAITCSSVPSRSRSRGLARQRHDPAVYSLVKMLSSCAESSADRTARHPLPRARQAHPPLPAHQHRLAVTSPRLTSGAYRMPLWWARAPCLMHSVADEYFRAASSLALDRTTARARDTAGAHGGRIAIQTSRPGRLVQGRAVEIRIELGVGHHEGSPEAADAGGLGLNENVLDPHDLFRTLELPVDLGKMIPVLVRCHPPVAHERFEPGHVFFRDQYASPSRHRVHLHAFPLCCTGPRSKAVSVMRHSRKSRAPPSGTNMHFGRCEPHE